MKRYKVINDKELGPSVKDMLSGHIVASASDMLLAEATAFSMNKLYKQAKKRGLVALRERGL